jgi:hypothetical protein
LGVSGSSQNPLARRPNLASSGQEGSSASSHKSTSSTQTSGKSKSNVVISVKDTKIDAMKYIQSISRSGDSKKNAPAKVDAAPEEKNASSSNSSSSQRRRRSKGYGGESSESCCKCDPHEEAIKFEFSVSFNGREYTATRSLPRILQFRYDLIEEFRARRMWRERRRKRKESTPPALSKVRDLSDDEEEENAIPEIPRLSEDATGRSGFAILNALIRPYGPALEGWLKKVIDIVPHDSQCLTQFLWEPLAGQPEQPASPSANKKKLEKRRSSLSASCSSLGAILEADDGEDSDSEDYLINH